MGQDYEVVFVNNKMYDVMCSMNLKLSFNVLQITANVSNCTFCMTVWSNSIDIAY